MKDKIIKKYNNLQLKTKLTWAIVFATLLPVVLIALIFGNKLYDMVISDTIKSEQTSTSEAAPLVEKKLEEINRAFSQLIDYDYFKELFNEQVKSDLCDMSETSEASDFATEVKNLTDSSCISNVRIYLGIEGDDPFFSSDSSQDLFLPESNITSTYWHGIFQGSNISELYCPQFYLGKHESSQFGDCAYIFKTSINCESNVIPAYVVLYYNSSEFSSILDENIELDGCVSYIINDRESIVATTSPSLSGLYRLTYRDIRKSLMSSNNAIEQDVLGKTVYVAFFYLESTDWFIVTVIPRTPLIDKANQAIEIFVMIAIICIILALIIALHQSNSITSRLSPLIRQMSRVRESTPVALPEPPVQDEIGELISSYNYMTKQMNDLIAQEKETAEELRLSEFNSLQAQINPHFLYNTMDMINWMAVQGKTDEVSNVVKHLARFYKLTLSKKNNFSTIENELEHVEVYIELQNMRFGGNIDYVADIPDELYKNSIPKLTLQPIVENSILHGIMEKPEKQGTIVITGWIEDQDVVLLISDDGVGIPEDIIGDILSEDRKATSPGSNIAIWNIHKRLQILYGEDYGLSYASRPGQGCEVTLRVPLD